MPLCPQASWPKSSVSRLRLLTSWEADAQQLSRVMGQPRTCGGSREPRASVFLTENLLVARPHPTPGGLVGKT